MTLLEQTTSSYQDDFQRTGGERDLPSWLRPLRHAALSRFDEVGFPDRHDEEFRFTPVTPIAQTPFRLAEAGLRVRERDVAPFVFDGLRGCRLVFVNGRYAPELSSLNALPARVTVTSLGEALRSDPERVEPHLARHAGVETLAFTALNTAFLADGAFVHIGRGVVGPEPIHLLFLAVPGDGPTVAHPRTLIVAEENSQATVIESYAGLPGGQQIWTNAVTEIAAGPSAVLDHYKLHREPADAFHTANTQIRLDRSSTFASHSITLGGALVRNDVGLYLAAEGIECTLNGLYLATGRQLVDNHTTIDHAQPRCNSHELYKGILDGHGRGVFNGKIFVREDAQKTDAKQSNQALLLSPDAQINTKPQLEIFADDVRCTHGATVGQLSDEAIFYLRTRGIGARDARNLLTYAFAGDILERIQVEPIRDQLREDLLARLGQREA